MGQDAIDKAAREAARMTRLGPEPRCGRCGWADPRALQREGNEVVCYECASARRGRPTVEEHHLVGRGNDPATAGTPGNLHRALEEAKRGWPEAVRRNAERDPALWLAAGAFSLRDQLEEWLKLFKAVAEWLVVLSAALRERFGPRWWEALGLPPLWGAA
jgi:hypothetical protein